MIENEEDKRRFTFTEERLAKRKKPPVGHTHCYDLACSALAMRVTAKGSKVYKAYHRGGSPHFLHIAQFGEISLEAARLAAQDILYSMRVTGLTPEAQEAARSEERQREGRLNVSLREVLAEYATVRVKKGRKRTIKTSSADNMVREVEKYLVAVLDEPLRSLTYAVLNAQHEAIIDRFTASMADKAMVHVRTLINYLEEKEETHLFACNPAGKVLRLDGHNLQPRKTNLPAKRFPDFFDAVAKMNVDARDFLLVSLFTGLRAESVRTLRFALIDFDEKVATLTVAKGQLDNTVRLPLSDFVIRILRRRESQAGDCPFVFPHQTDPTRCLLYHDHYMDCLWQAGGGEMRREDYHVHDKHGKPKFKKNGEPLIGNKPVLSGASNVCTQDRTPLKHHDLRRTFCSIAAGAAGVDVFTAMRLSLHEVGGGATQQHSDYVDLEHLRPGLERISEAILRLRERPRPVDGSGADNVLAFIPRRSASAERAPQDKRAVRLDAGRSHGELPLDDANGCSRTSVGQSDMFARSADHAEIPVRLPRDHGGRATENESLPLLAPPHYLATDNGVRGPDEQSESGYAEHKRTASQRLALLGAKIL